MPAVLAMACAALFILAVPFMFIKLGGDRKGPAAAVPQDDEMLAGERIYQRNCLSCHENHGEGRPGQYPPLASASWLLDDVETPIRLLLLGAAGPMEVEGKRYDNVMPNFGVNLSDEDLANVLTYARGSWGNRGSSVTPHQVARVRASLAGKHGPWTAADLLAARKAAPSR